MKFFFSFFLTEISEKLLLWCFLRVKVFVSVGWIQKQQNVWSLSKIKMWACYRQCSDNISGFWSLTVRWTQKPVTCWTTYKLDWTMCWTTSAGHLATGIFICLCFTFSWVLSDYSFSVCFSFQSRINDCMRQMASLLYQIKGPLNANTKNQVEADSDNMLRPLMDFLDGKYVGLVRLMLKVIFKCICTLIWPCSLLSRLLCFGCRLVHLLVCAG